MEPNQQRHIVSNYYGETLKSSSDLRTSACCPVDAVPAQHRHILAQLHPEITKRFYGCGSPIPSNLEGTSVLDLGCGTGRDAYLASALVGPTGTVVGVDMTNSQLKVAREYQKYHANLFFNDPNASNVNFRLGQIEDLTSADIKAASFDVVISNCVCNLSPEKDKVFSEVFRALKSGGEFYFSDVYADRRLTPEAASNPTLIGECLGGALYLEDFRRVMAKVGFADVRVFSFAPITINDPTLTPLVADVSFFSVTFRAFKIEQAEDRKEDYSQIATYKQADVDKRHQSDQFILDVDNKFKAEVPRRVDANTAAILQNSRFRSMFDVSAKGNHNGCFTRASDAPVLHPLLDCFRPAPRPSTMAPSISPTVNGECGEPKDCEPSSGCGPSAKAETCCAPGSSC